MRYELTFHYMSFFPFLFFFESCFLVKPQIWSIISSGWWLGGYPLKTCQFCPILFCTMANVCKFSVIFFSFKSSRKKEKKTAWLAESNVPHQNKCTWVLWDKVFFNLIIYTIPFLMEFLNSISHIIMKTIIIFVQCTYKTITYEPPPGYINAMIWNRLEHRITLTFALRH